MNIGMNIKNRREKLGITQKQMAENLSLTQSMIAQVERGTKIPNWALRHLEQFPVEVNRASYEELLRVPGIGVKSARRIVQARRSSRLEYQHLKKIGVVLKRAIYFITCNGRQMYPLRIEENFITRQLLGIRENLPFEKDGVTYQQLSLFDDRNFGYDGKQLVQPESAWKDAVG